MMFTSSGPLRRVAFVVAAFAVALFPIAILFGSTTSGGAGDSGVGSGPNLLVRAVLVLVGLFLLWAFVSALREPRRFLRIASGLTTLVLVAFLVTAVIGTALVLLPGSDNISVGGGEGISVYASSIEVSGDSGTIWGRSDDAIGKEERQWTRRKFGPGAEHVQESGVRVTAKSPSAGAWALSWLLIAVRFLVVGLVLWLLRTILVRSVRGAPFAAGNALALRGIAAGLGLWWLSSVVIEPLAQRAVIASAGGTGHYTTSQDVTPLLIALFVLALAEVWRYGIELQREAEATV